MREVVIIQRKDGEVIDKPDYLSQDYVYILAYYNTILREIKRDREGDADFLLDKLFELKYKLKYMKQALNGKHSIIVLVDFTSR
ncbi:MAG: hypothetical protein J7J01_00040 [Methanophagales archaeon]|nr:hypothetical protein [Methanophagales archaeon]